MHYHRLFYSLLFTGISSAIHAQQDMADLMDLSPAELADISVSIASGTLKPVSHSAAVTTVITAEQIASMGATELHEVLETVPGLHATIQPVTNDYSFTMRGMRNETNAEVLLMMNGTRFSVPYQGTHMAGMMIPVENIQRIEVIRGPGSALYGADAFAGVINIITKKAADLDGFTVGARGGNADTESTWGQYGGQWQGWNVSTSLQYSHNGVDGSRIIQADAQSQLDTALGTRVSLAPGPMQTQNERLNGHLNLQRKHWDLSFWAFNESDFGFRAGTTGALDNKGRGSGSNYLADARFSSEDMFDDFELQAHASFLHTEVDASIYNFPPGTVLPIGQDGNPSREFRTARPMLFPEGMRFMTGINNTVPSFELTGIYKGLTDHLLRMVAGFRYEELNTEESRNYGPGVINPTDSMPPSSVIDVTDTPYTFIGNHHRDIWSMALQDEWQFATAWHLTSGIRYDHYSDFGNTWNPRVALVWDINPQLTGKLLYGQAYRAPSFVEQYQNNSPLFIGNREVRPETIETTELAFDYRPSSTLRTALNIYYYEINDLITQSNEKQDTLTVENTPGQDGLGSEFEWEWKFHPDWNLMGNYAWQYTRDDSSHAQITYVPEHHVYSAVAWHFLPKWQIQTQVNWIGHRSSDTNDNRSLEDYETVDLTLNAKKLMGYLDLTASVRNLFDANGKEPDITPAQSYPYNLPIAAQTFYFEASVHF